MESLRAAAGQQFLFNFSGYDLSPQLVEFVKETRPGGVILFGRNIASGGQVRALVQGLQGLAARIHLAPLIVGVDDEGGRVTRLSPDLYPLVAPSQMAQAAAGGPEAARTCALTTAGHLRRLGFTLNFAPVADVNNNAANPIIGARSFGEDPALVGDCVAAAVEGYLDGGIAPCAKHFPGHGDTTVDSHLGLPVVDKTLTDLDSVELVPFTRAIAAGVPAIMSAHIVYPQIDASGRPATLSPILLRDLLRQQMGFAGLIVTDALNMQAIAAHWSLDEAVHAALAAGAMLLTPGRDLDAQYACYRALLRAAEDGVFDVQGEAARVAAHKARFVEPLLPALEQPLDPDAAQRAFAEEAAAVAEVARRSLTLLRNADGLLPLSPARARHAVLVDFDVRSGPEVEDSWQPGPILPAALGRYLPGVHTVAVSKIPTAEEGAEALAQAASADVLILVTRNAFRLPAQAALAGRLLAAAPRAVVVAAREPYDLAVLPAAGAYMATYADPPVSLQAVADLLCGAFPPQGRLPVTIPGVATSGAGMSGYDA